MRHNKENDNIIELEHFDGNISLWYCIYVPIKLILVDMGWRENIFKFDGFLSGLGELADKIMNQLGVGRLIVRKQKKWVIGEIKSYMRGMAVCMMWSPSMGLELCMRQYWIDLGWEYPWVYPSCN